MCVHTIYVFVCVYSNIYILLFYIIFVLLSFRSYGMSLSSPSSLLLLCLKIAFCSPRDENRGSRGGNFRKSMRRRRRKKKTREGNMRKKRMKVLKRKIPGETLKIVDFFPFIICHFKISKFNLVP